MTLHVKHRDRRSGWATLAYFIALGVIVTMATLGCLYFVSQCC